MAPCALSQTNAAALLRSSILASPLPAPQQLRTNQRQEDCRKFAVRAAEEVEGQKTGFYKYTGIKTDTTGISLVDVVEPNVYVSKEGAFSTELATVQALAVGVIALVAAGAVLVFTGDKAPIASGPTLSELVSKFEAEVGAPAPVPAPAPAPAPAPVPVAAAIAAPPVEIVEEVVVVVEEAPALEAAE